MGIRNKAALRNSWGMDALRPKNAMDNYIGTFVKPDADMFESKRAKRLMERAIRAETRYERRKRR